MTKQILVTVSIVCTFLTGMNAVAAQKTGTPDQVCPQILKVKVKKGVVPELCYDQAKRYLKSRGIKVMTGSYQAYFALSSKDKSQNKCRNFLKDVVHTTSLFEIDDADQFTSNRAYSLDRAFYSYLSCQEWKSAKVSQPRKARLTKSQKQKSPGVPVAHQVVSVQPVHSIDLVRPEPVVQVQTQPEARQTNLVTESGDPVLSGSGSPVLSGSDSGAF